MFSAPVHSRHPVPGAATVRARNDSSGSKNLSPAARWGAVLLPLRVVARAPGSCVVLAGAPLDGATFLDRGDMVGVAVPRPSRRVHAAPTAILDRLLAPVDLAEPG